MTGVPGCPWRASTALSMVSPSVGLAVDLEDQVAGQDARGVGRGADHRGDHLEPLGVLVDLDGHADAAELALDLLLERLPLRGVDVGRVRVEVGEHPPQGALHQLAAGDGPDVVLLDLLDGVDEDAVQLRDLVLGLGPLAGLPAEQRDRADHHDRVEVPSRHEIGALPGGFGCRIGSDRRRIGVTARAEGRVSTPFVSLHSSLSSRAEASSPISPRSPHSRATVSRESAGRATRSGQPNPHLPDPPDRRPLPAPPIAGRVGTPVACTTLHRQDGLRPVGGLSGSN